MAVIDDDYRAGLQTSNYADNPYQWGTHQYNQFERGVTMHRKALEALRLSGARPRRPSYRDKSKHI